MDKLDPHAFGHFLDIFQNTKNQHENASFHPFKAILALQRKLPSYQAAEPPSPYYCNEFGSSTTSSSWCRRTTWKACVSAALDV
jgi:hypothetical protein